MFFLRKSELKTMGWFLIGMMALILSFYPPYIWLPFSSEFPDWFIYYPIIWQIGKMGPYFIVGCSLAAGYILIRRLS